MADDKTKSTEIEEAVAAEPSKEEEIPETPEEETPESAPAEEATTEEEQPEEETPEEKPPSRREQLRIQKLLQRYGPPPVTPQPAQPREALDYNQALEADPEVIKQLEADRQAAGQAQYQAGAESTRAEIRTSEWRTLLNFDAPQTEAKYGWLNPKDSEHFDPAMADAVNQEYKNVVGYDEQTGLVARPDIRYSDFIEARVELSTRLAKAMTANTAKNIAQQAAVTGLRPDGSSAKRLNLDQAPEDMSIEELYAKIGQTPPKKK